MALPSGYIQLEYIESSGSQYVDTGFKHNQDTRVVMDVTPLSQAANAWLFEGRISSSSAAKGIFYYYSSTQKWSADYNSSSGRYGFSDGETDHLLIDYNKNTCTVNGVSKNWTAAAFQSTVNLCLLACNTAGTISGFAKAKLYSCRIYDNGTLVRDYVPAKRESDSAVGLYDTANNVFYVNAGDGEFTSGPEEGIRNYTRLEYVQSSSTQHIDTNFIPNANTRILLDCEVLEFKTSAYCGCCTQTPSSSAATNALIMINGTSVRSDFYGSVVSSSSVATGRHTVDRNKNITASGSSITINNTASSNESEYPLFLFARNAIGTPDLQMSMKLYASQIYDDGILVRDFVPVKRNSDNVVGLYDTVSNVFYTNAGTGAFTYGELPKVHKTLINGTIFEISGGRALVDGTVYNIKNGRTMIDGTIFQISFRSTYTITIDGTIANRYTYIQIGDTKITKTGTYTIDSSEELELTVRAASQQKDDGATYMSYIYLNGVNVTPDDTTASHGYSSKYYTLNTDEKNINISFNWNDVNLYYVVNITTSN